MRKQFIIRVRLILGALLAVTAILVARLYFVQIVEGSDYRQQAQNQYVAQAQGLIDRGTIYFADGTKEAAAMRTGYDIAIRPDDVSDPAGEYAALNAITPIDHDRFFADVAKKGDPYEEIAFKIPEAAGEKVISLSLPGVIVVSDAWRYYPGGDLASQVLGFVGYGPSDPDHQTGLYGLERTYDDTLSRSGGDVYVNFFAQVFANLQSLVASNDSQRQGDIVTTIDPSVQQQLQAEIAAVQAKYRSKLTGGIVMDPNTGAIIAMANVPTFDPNDYASASSTAVYRNAAVSSEYEFGSVMKAITMAAGIDAGVVTPESTYDDKGYVDRGGIRIWNYDFLGRGPGTTMQTVLDLSLNTGAVHVEDLLGHALFEKYLKAFGFGTPSGIDLPGEVPGHVAAYVTGSDADFASTAFGQSLAVTPVEMIRALAALANGGYLVHPHVVSAIRYTDGSTKQIAQPAPVRVISTSTAQTIDTMLAQVYDVALMNGAVKMQHYSAASKTGTAQLEDPSTGAYYTDQYLHSFFGFFPAYGARYIIFLYTVEPQGEEYASHTLTTPFVDMVHFLINYYNIPPDR
ncbi:MAG TPA: penicillin-binding protein 2 [Candidatus Paceibacterota bacterium]|nr:penicillin-binding protein 2 [Candidatus Paceibacterota bacterium]